MPASCLPLSLTHIVLFVIQYKSVLTGIRSELDVYNGNQLSPGLSVLGMLKPLQLNFRADKSLCTTANMTTPDVLAQ